MHSRNYVCTYYIWFPVLRLRHNTCPMHCTKQRQYTSCSSYSQLVWFGTKPIRNDSTSKAMIRHTLFTTKRHSSNTVQLEGKTNSTQDYLEDHSQAETKIIFTPRTPPESYFTTHFNHCHFSVSVNFEADEGFSIFESYLYIKIFLDKNLIYLDL